ncbi:MAG: FHA domain-containing protein [Lysobacterales bacterium]|nr:FHA domain-containing protein [Xanthomonadales bacterium]MCB1612557.1 FHA domain-containing protein [Xanthomonadales bacterium]MCP5473389.1 FHA domain-containing protein [Rhodanobacteraceae bacterium]
MALDLNSVDLSAVEALAAIKSEQDQLGERLKTMESKRSQVSAEVYQRVHSDYRKRQAELMSQAAPLIQKAGESYRALRMELIELESAFKTAQLDREEVDFRHALGEFDEKELANRVKAVDARIAEHGKARTRALALKERFLAVVTQESDLDTSDEDTARMEAIPASVAQGDSAATVIAAPIKDAAPKGDPDATLVAPLPPLKPVPPPAAVVSAATPPPAPAVKRPRNPDATVVFRQGRLEPRNAEAGSVVQTLGLKPISIGSDSACDLQLTAPGIAKRQLEITMTRAGFCVRDVAANGAVKINGEMVQERVLAESDTLSVGPAQFNFRLL